MSKRIILSGLFVLLFAPAWAQYSDSPYLLDNIRLQFEVTDGVNNLYNFEFTKAEKEFNYIRFRYPNHPLPYFLLGLSNWWKIAPNVDNKDFDKPFFAYMDTVIDKAERMFDANENDIEAVFFLAAAYGFKGRLL